MAYFKSKLTMIFSNIQDFYNKILDIKYSGSSFLKYLKQIIIHCPTIVHLAVQINKME